VSRLSFTELAAQDLEQIFEYIADDNIAAAVKHWQRLEKRWCALLDQPRMGTQREDIEPNLRSVTEGNYVIFYRILPDGIEVARVLNASQDLGQAFLPLAQRPKMR
jgi:toxin ParE1/3/4